MDTTLGSWSFDPRLNRAHVHARRGEVLQAELLYRAVLRDHCDCVPASRAVAAFALDRGDTDTARRILSDARQSASFDTDLLFDLAQVQGQSGDVDAARVSLEALLAIDPAHHVAWLMLAELRDVAGDTHGALRARYQAVSRAQSAGNWLMPGGIDPSIVASVTRNMDKLRIDRRDFLYESFDIVRQDCGASAVSRVEHALSGYLGEWDATPPDRRQRPKFLYFPGLPAGPYHDPMLQPWAARMRDAFPDIRVEAMSLLVEDRDFESFLGLKPGQRAPSYVGGSNPNASWDAYFFYRRGQRFEQQHLRCPKTSALIDSIELCRVERQAPEVCFSVIRPQSTIVAHHGVTNTRLVMHLPLIVPPDCAFNIVGAGEHRWTEGELMMFDDTFEHEAWNRSDQPRLILLMDCWNPHLTDIERRATKLLIEAIDSIEN